MPRTHSDEQIAQIAASIAEFGFVNLVLIGSDRPAVGGATPQHNRGTDRADHLEVPIVLIT